MTPDSDVIIQIERNAHVLMSINVQYSNHCIDSKDAGHFIQIKGKYK